MKKIFGYILTAALGLASLASCHQDLNIVYDNKLTKDIMWQDPSDLEQSVPAMYSLLRGFLGASERNVFYLGEIRVGDYMWGPSLKDKVQDNFKIACRHNIMNPSNTIGWGSAYNVIDQANAVLMHATDCNASEADVNAAYAQAYFARAFAYFYAVRIWGEIPLNLKPVESTTQPECYPEQATAAQVYEQIGKDIEAAEACGDVLGSDKYLGTKDALMMLKAEYALWMYSTQDGGNAYLDMAESALNAIGISSSKLLPNYGKIFDRGNRKNAEVIFAMNNTSTATAGYQVYFCHSNVNIASKYRQSPVPISSTQWWHYSPGFQKILLDSKAAGDTRVDTNLGIGNYGADGGEISWCNKLLGDMSGSAVRFDNDLLYYRYALAVMMHAELKYYQGKYADANKSLNLIAKRAYGKDDYYTATGKDEVLNNIVKEYFLEFPAEGVIWWALIRTGKIWDYEPNSEIAGQTFATMRQKNPNILLWPIPQGSLNKNPKWHQIQGWQ